MLSIPYDVIYDDEIIDGKLHLYDWLHLHHEDFTGQYGKFYGSYRNAKWYQDQVQEFEETANRLGFAKVSELKLAVALRNKRIHFWRRFYVFNVLWNRFLRYCNFI